MNSEPKNFGISPPSLFSALLFAHSALAHFAHFAHFAFFAFFALVGLAAFVALEHLRHLSSLHDFDISVLSDLFYVCSPQLSTLRADRADRAVLLAPPPLAARRPRPRLCCARRADEATQRVGAGTLPLRPLAVPQSTITKLVQPKVPEETHGNPSYTPALNSRFLSKHVQTLFCAFSAPFIPQLSIAST